MLRALGFVVSKEEALHEAAKKGNVERARKLLEDDPDLEWRDGVHPQQGARPRPAAAVGRFARELAALGGPMSLLEPRRLLVECGGCSLHQDAHTLLLGEVRDEL